MGVHLHLRHGSGRKAESAAPPPPPPVPKGWMAIRVGQEGEEQQRFVVPLVYLNHPLFVGLLKEAEEEYGFDQKGAITIPCHVEYFRQVKCVIDRDTAVGAAPGGGHHHHGGTAGGGGGHHFHLCFRA